ncbi:MAG: PEP-CTERM sorting domain-containing protein [Proteobacteria bacterium]|nr:PEP-CTERM sorting domain-containing protein [Pseudomonadota bacterium]
MLRTQLFRGGLGTLVLTLALLPGTAAALSASGEADYDRWMYPFNGTPGVRGLAPTFNAIGSDDGMGNQVFDQADGQFLVGFDTAAAGVTSGLGASSYLISSLTITTTHFQGDFVYDGTADSYTTHLDPSDPNYTPDSDAGRPIELYGVDFRGGFSGIEFSPGVPGPPGFEESDAFAFADITLPEVRNAFPTDLANGDVSNYVRDGFDPVAFAIGQSSSGLLPGDIVPEGVPGSSAGETFEFSVDVSNPLIQQYLREALDAGALGFVVLSLHDAGGQAGGNNPNFYTSDNFDPAAIAPTFSIEFSIVPEPGTFGLASFGLLGLAAWGRRRRLSDV